jgi:hypothetical protein
VAAPTDNAALIRSLCDPDPVRRNLAAAVLFERGSRSIRLVTQQWLSFAPLAALLRRDPETANLAITVGLAVEPENFERIRAANGVARLANVPPDQDALEFELVFPGGLRLDILTTGRPHADGAIARFLRKFREGIQQVEIGVVNVTQATRELRERFGIEAIYPATRVGADGTAVNFFLVAAPEGKKVLIELVESANHSEC